MQVGGGRSSFSAFRMQPNDLPFRVILCHCMKAGSLFLYLRAPRWKGSLDGRWAFSEAHNLKERLLRYLSPILRGGILAFEDTFPKEGGSLERGGVPSPCKEKNAPYKRGGESRGTDLPFFR